MVVEILYILIEIVIISVFILGALFVSYINLNYKDEIWEDIYERMGWNEASIE